MFKLNIRKVLKKHCANSIDAMCSDKTSLHSFNIINPDSPTKAATMWLLFVPAKMDVEIYEALKPIFDRHFGSGALVKPGIQAQNAIKE